MSDRPLLRMISDRTVKSIKQYGMDGIAYNIYNAKEYLRFEEEQLVDFLINNNYLIHVANTKIAQYREKLRVQQELLKYLMGNLHNTIEHLSKSGLEGEQSSAQYIGEYTSKINEVLVVQKEYVMRSLLRTGEKAFFGYILENRLVSTYLCDEELAHVDVSNDQFIMTLIRAHAGDCEVAGRLITKYIANRPRDGAQTVRYAQDYDLEAFDSLVCILTNFDLERIGFFVCDEYSRYRYLLCQLYEYCYDRVAESVGGQDPPITDSADSSVIFDYFMKCRGGFNDGKDIPDNMQQTAALLRRLARIGQYFARHFNAETSFNVIPGLTSAQQLDKQRVMGYILTQDGQFLARRNIHREAQKMRGSVRDGDGELLRLFIGRYAAGRADLHFQLEQCVDDPEGDVAMALGGI